MKEFLENLLRAFLRSLTDDSDIDIDINSLIDDYNIPMTLEDKRALVCFVYDLIEEHKNGEVE